MAVAIVLCFLVIANLAPFSEALPNTLLWTWLGVLAMPYTSVLRVRVPAYARERAAVAVPRRRELAPLHLSAPRQSNHQHRDPAWVTGLCARLRRSRSD